ncbi:unnamed protein product [Eruca vesicaria subsp. sativa]|uniref:Uncharacterized protein n=1 Tax=Eruca vesicaria subsp. sativa TaxID=29727 RepID=A0ABC8J2Y5_ERUVS|nr:unnamed protein product [Eruca vesicaria subsp. sativa]
MILALGARGPEFDSRNAPLTFSAVSEVRDLHKSELFLSHSNHTTSNTPSLLQRKWCSLFNNELMKQKK